MQDDGPYAPDLEQSLRDPFGIAGRLDQYIPEFKADGEEWLSKAAAEAIGAVAALTIVLIESAETPDIPADPTCHESAALDTFVTGACAQQQAHLSGAQGGSGVDGKCCELEALAQLAAALLIFVAVGLQPWQLDLPILGQALHQPETDHAECLIGGHVDGVHRGLLRKRHRSDRN